MKRITTCYECNRTLYCVLIPELALWFCKHCARLYLEELIKQGYKFPA